MPYTPDDATRHTKKATTPKLKKTFSTVANKVLIRGGSEASAIRIANAAVKKGKVKK